MFQYSLYNKVTKTGYIDPVLTTEQKFLHLCTCSEIQSCSPGWSKDLGIPTIQKTLHLSKFAYPGMILSRNFNSAAVAKAHKQCSLDSPYTCIYQGVKKKKDGRNTAEIERANHFLRFSLIIQMYSTDLLKILDLFPKVAKSSWKPYPIQ